MKGLVIGLIIGSLLTGVCYGYRIPKPQKIIAFDQNGLVILNDALERLYDLTNGRYTPNFGTAASTGTGTVKMGSANPASSAGWIKFEKYDGTIAYVPYWTDETP